MTRRVWVTAEITLAAALGGWYLVATAPVVVWQPGLPRDAQPTEVLVEFEVQGALPSAELVTAACHADPAVVTCALPVVVDVPPIPGRFRLCYWFRCSPWVDVARLRQP